MRLLGFFAAFALVLAFSFPNPAAAGSKKKPTGRDIKVSLEHQTKGNTLDEQGNTVEAIDEYKKALAHNPDDANTLFDMGAAYLKINMPEEAAKAFEAVTKIEKKDTETYNLLGLAYRGSGRVNDAIKTWEKSLSLDPSQTLPKKFIEEAEARSNAGRGSAP